MASKRNPHFAIREGGRATGQRHRNSVWPTEAAPRGGYNLNPVPHRWESIMANIPLKGSERTAMRGARELAPTDPTERLEVTILVRRRARQDLATRVAAGVSGRAAGSYLSRDEFAKRHGADPADLAAVRAFAAAHGLAVEQEDAARRTVVLSGTAAQFCAAFPGQLRQMSHPRGSDPGPQGAILLPRHLAGIVEGLLGLDIR